jgi:predicted dehydrogenase
MWHVHLHRTPERVRSEIFPLAVPAPEQAILDEFFAAIREDREPECSARDNLKSLAMVFAAIQSAKEGRRVELAELSA